MLQHRRCPSIIRPILADIGSLLWLSLVGFAVCWCFELAESFFLVADSVGERCECGAEVADFGGETGEHSRVVAAVAVFFDDGSELRIAVEGRSADRGAFRDCCERDGSWLAAS